MLRFFKYLFATIFTIGGILILLVVSIGYFLFGDSRGCDGDSQAALYARSLSQDRLEKLYRDVEIYYHNQDLSTEDYYFTEENNVPIEFRDLEVVRVSPKRTHIMVEGCFDHYMYLRFTGITDNEPKSILLSYGEFEVIHEKLWPK